MRAPRKALFIALILLGAIIQPFLAIVPRVKASPASPSGMEQVLFGGYWDPLHNTVTEYNSIVGAASWKSTESHRYKIVSTDGIIKNLRVKLYDYPGYGNKYTFTLILNGNPTSLTLEIADLFRSGSDMVHKITVTGGDYVSLQCVPYSTPTPREAYWTSVFEGDTAKESLIVGGSHDALNNIDVEYGQVMGGYTTYSAIEDDYRQIIPTDGIIKNFHVKLDADPGTAPDAYRFTLRKGGASQTLTVTINADDTTGSDLVNSFAVVAGDVLTFMIEPLNTPSATPLASWGMTFLADIDGESIVLGGSSSSPLNDRTQYNYLISYSSSVWSTTEDQRHSFGQTCTLKKLYVLLANAPGAGNSYEFRIRVADAETDVGVYIAGLETTGHSSVNAKVDITNDEYIGLQCIPTSSPASADAYWSLVCYTGPPISPPPYTEKFETFSIAVDASWTDYNLFTNLGVPKGAVAEIVCYNKNVDNEREAGVRTDGSTLARFVDLHEAEGLGVTTVSMFVKCNETTGLIECYSEIQGDIDFILLGYFNSSFDFTEKFTDMGTPVFSWEDKNLSEYGVPGNAVVQTLLINYGADAMMGIGVRENGSSLIRYINLDEAEDGGQIFLSMIVKADENSIIEWKGRSGIATDKVFLLGWFSSNIDFVEGFTDYSPADDNIWTEKTITQSHASSVVAFVLVHEDSGSETFCGLREDGSVIARMIEEHEAEGGGSTGFHSCVTVDADKKCEVYCEDASESQFYYTGYFIIIIAPVKPNIPSLVVIYFNTTMAGEWCGVYAEFFDTEGLYGYIFWNNATSAPGGVNSSFTSMTGTSNSTQENVTLPSSGILFGCKYYVNDTDGYWGRDTLAMFPTASVAGDTIIMGASGVFWIIFIIIVPIVGYVLKKG